MLPRSISRYISLQIILLVAIVMLVFIAMINLVYDWGNDDSVHYFMSLEAENYIEHNRPTESIPEWPAFLLAALLQSQHRTTAFRITHL